MRLVKETLFTKRQVFHYYVRYGTTTVCTSMVRLVPYYYRQSTLSSFAVDSIIIFITLTKTKIEQIKSNQIKSNHNKKVKDKYSSKLINTTPPWSFHYHHSSLLLYSFHLRRWRVPAPGRNSHFKPPMRSMLAGTTLCTQILLRAKPYAFYSAQTYVKVLPAWPRHFRSM